MDHPNESSVVAYSPGILQLRRTPYSSRLQFAHEQPAHAGAALAGAALAGAARAGAANIRTGYGLKTVANPTELYRSETPLLSPRCRPNAHDFGGNTTNILGSSSPDRATIAPLFEYRKPVTPKSHWLEINAGDHLELDDEDGQDLDAVPYEHVRMLGLGGHASVEMVRDTNTGSVYARKSFRNVYARNREDAKRELMNEVHIMRRLASHRHIARVHATYMKCRELAIILDPVADGGDLANFLLSYRDRGFQLLNDGTKYENLSQNEILCKAFGCLASALAFIHEQTIRHKDIKPQNILIHRGEVMYTDFGLSYDFGDVGRSTTTGKPQGFTRKYCAPEVAKGDSRNSKSDVFSLGCVYIDICLALANDASYDQMYGGPFCEIVQSYAHGLPLPCAMFSHSDGGLFGDVIKTMVSIDSASRPSASTIAYMISECASSSFFCSTCNEKYQST